MAMRTRDEETRAIPWWVPGKKFELGQLVVTSGVAELMETTKLDVLALTRRHQRGDWGDLDPFDRRLNDEALRTGEERLFSAYETEEGRIWIITEWDRSVTTVLLPKEY